MSPARPDYFAAHPAQVPALLTACLGWRGTPFRPRSLVKGPHGGVDCVGFVGAVFAETAPEVANLTVPGRPRSLDPAAYYPKAG